MQDIVITEEEIAVLIEGAKQRIQAQEYDAAYNDYRKILSLSPNDATAYHGIGVIYYYRNDLENAKEYFLRAIAINPSYALSHYSLAGIYFAQEQYEQAEAHYQETIYCDPKEIDAYCYLGVIYEIWQQYDQAESYYYKALDCDPKYTRAYNNLGFLYAVHKKDYQSAKNHFQSALECDPHNAIAYYNLGAAYNYLHEYEKALDCFKQGLTYDPQNIYVYLGVGVIEYCLAARHEDYQKAADALQRYLMMQEDQESEYTLMAHALTALCHQHYHKAIDYFTRALQENESAVYYLGRAEARYALDEIDAKGLAQADFDKAKAFSPRVKELTFTKKNISLSLLIDELLAPLSLENNDPINRRSKVISFKTIQANKKRRDNFDNLY